MGRSKEKLSVAVVMTLLGVGLLSPAAEADENDLLEFCLDEPDYCALSVVALDEGWERHINADRPQSLASTFKVVALMAYAEAVAEGAVSPDDTVAKEAWARYFSGGSTLETSWNDLGQPDQVRLDDLARVMILNSDNSAPDFFLETLKSKLVKKALKQFPWHDATPGISAMFGLWGNHNGIGGTGNRIVADYGGMESVGYRKELSKHTKSLRKDSAVETVRRSICQQPPWIAGPPPCNQPQPFTNEANQRILETHHFTRSTTRSYASLMRGLIEGSVLSAEAQDVVDRNLDQAWFGRFPTLSPAFSRYGLKGGSLATASGLQVLTWAHYMEAGGDRYVVVVFLQNLNDTNKAPDTGDVNAFAQQFALNSAFRETVRSSINDHDLPTELVPYLKKVSLKGNTVTVKAKVYNSSPVKSQKPITASLYILDDTGTAGAKAVDTARVGKVSPFKKKSANLKFRADGNIKGKLAVVLIDSDDKVEEQDEENNLTWQRLD